MNSKNCSKCSQANPIETKFCYRCGTAFSAADNNELQPTMLAGGLSGSSGGQNFYGGQTPPTDFQQQYQQQQGWQPTPTPPPSFVPPSQGGSGFSVKKILVGAGSVLFGLIMLAAGGVKLYKAFGTSSSTETTVNSSPAAPQSNPQPLYSNTNSSSSNSGSFTPFSTPSSPSSSSSVNTAPSVKTTRTIADITQQKAGAWTLRETIQGNPEKDGFAGATAEKQFKYYDTRDDFVHLTIADYPTAAAAETALRTQMANFKKLKIKVGEETGAIDNDKNPIGITQTMTSANGKIHARYWTNKNFLMRIVGAEKSAEDFFRASNF